MSVPLALLSFLSPFCVQLARGGGGPGERVEVAGPTLVWGDFDRDGLQDVYAILRSGQDHLLHNEGDGSFADVSRQAFAEMPFASRTAAWGDANGDGWNDLFVVSALGTSRLFENLGNGAFAERSREAALAPIQGATEARWLDYDGDRRMDLVLTGPGVELLLHNEGDWRFERIALPSLPPSEQQTGAGMPMGVPVPVTVPAAAAAQPDPDHGSGARSTTASGGGAGTHTEPRAGSILDAGGTSITSIVARSPGQPSVQKVVPSGLIFPSESPTAPSGYTATGLQLDVVSGPQLWTS